MCVCGSASNLIYEHWGEGSFWLLTALVVRHPNPSYSSFSAAHHSGWLGVVGTGTELAALKVLSTHFTRQPIDQPPNSEDGNMQG